MFIKNRITLVVLFYASAMILSMREVLLQKRWGTKTVVTLKQRATPETSEFFLNRCVEVTGPESGLVQDVA